MCGTVFPPCCLASGQTVVGVMKVMAISFKRTCAHTVVFSAPDPAAGHCQPMPPSETPGHSQASLAQSLVWTRFLSPGSWCTRGFVCALQESVSPVLWKFCNQGLQSQIPWGFSSLCWKPRLGNLLWALELLQQCENFFGIIVLQFVGHLLGGSNVWLMSTSSKGIDATHLCTSPHSQSLPSGSFHKPLIIIHQRGDRMKTTITVN